MAFAISLVDLAGYIALLLWGTHMVQTGVQRAFGAGLRAVLGKALQDRGRAFLAGLGVTAVLQSSTATGLMMSGFVADGLVALIPALAVMLGANVGTTLIVQVLSFDVSAVAPGLILLGVIMFRRNSSTRVHDLGRVFIGLGLMLLALHQLLHLLESFEDAPGFRLLLGSVSTVPFANVLIGAVAAWATHSSVAVVLLTMSLAANGAVPPAAAFALVLGANLGSAVTPVVEGPGGGDPAHRRLSIGNLVTRLAGVAAALALLEPAEGLMAAVEPDATRAVANFHTLFNLVVAAVFLPLLSPYARLLERLLPDRADPADPTRPRYLDPAAREVPIVALGAAAREALRLADVLAGMLDGAREALRSGDRRLMAETRGRDDILDSLNTAIKAYLTRLDPDDLSGDDERRLNEILQFTMNLEQAGDVVDLNLLPHAAKRLERGLVFEDRDRAELIALIDRLSANVRTAASLFMTEDVRAARLLAEEKVALREAETRATAVHFDRLRSGRPDVAQASALHLDLLRDLKLVNSYIVAAAAYPVLQRTGELLPSRLADDAHHGE
ncbi:Na/Pi cotransporter family protein [Pleomorphomonas carboxyditropha]|uniref:Na/Pi cotransporter n=1 Tax=Pleomorphomonas carboxyditropha TaxID=2023338 RepID=A0A2G9WSU8_9HYPH|nr:Na/Pi cotransporter family protein [Pleomorphomonas carboxyditropha]PIO97372.1 Na/Pi cotransporter [Pleomorphomonas carboxyditropha]